MSHLLRSHSADLRQLQEAGFDFVISDSRLIVREIPYRTARGEVAWGALTCPLNTEGDVTARPAEHTMYFAGEMPHDSQGASLESKLLAAHVDENIGGIPFKMNFSRMPDRGHYNDYFEKVTTYCKFICLPAAAIDPTATPYRHNPVAPDDPEDVFLYLDTNAARSNTGDLNSVFKGQRIGIVGLGGTGSYVLDLVAKCRVEEIRLFDGDTFKDHNAFRAPGAASVDDLKARQPKVAYFAGMYSRFRKGLTPIPDYLTEANLDKLEDLSFVFICMDPTPAKRCIVTYLRERNIPFVETGVGIHRQSDGLGGLSRVTLVTADTPQRFVDRIPYGDDGDDDLYATNIQVAEINAMAAIQCVLAWKRHLRFYDDLEKSFRNVYVIDGNILINSGGKSENQ